MSENSTTTCTVLHLRFKLRVPPRVLLAESRAAATEIASVEGLIWKTWVLQEKESEVGGIYLFANRETAEAYLNHPVIQAVRSNPAVVSTQSQLWGVESDACCQRIQQVSLSDAWDALNMHYQRLIA